MASFPNYYENVSILSRYILQAADYQREEFVKIESEVIKSKEDQIMKSTYDRLIDEGMERGRKEGIEKGKEEVALRMLEQNIELQLIAQITNLSIQQLQKLKK